MQIKLSVTNEIHQQLEVVHEIMKISMLMMHYHAYADTLAACSFCCPDYTAA